MKQLSQGSLNDADICQKRLDFKLVQGIRPKSSNERMAMGTAYGEVLEILYKTQKMEFDKVAEIIFREVTDAVDGFEWETDFETAVERTQAGLNAYQVKGCNWPEDKYEVVATEFELLHPLREEWQAISMIDLLLKEKSSDWFYIVDHKFGQKPWANSKHQPQSTNQPGWYLEAIKKWCGHSNVRFFFDVMTWEGSFQRIEAHRNSYHQDLMHVKADMVMDIVDAGGLFFPNQSHHLCSAKWCNHWYRCPYGDAWYRNL